MATFEIDKRKLNAELERQDRYLNHYHRIRVAVLPDKNCLFSAVCAAGNLAMDWYDLRIATADYIAGNMSDFHKFMSVNQGSTLLDNMPDIAEELKMMKDGDSWVGYETIMALSRHLEAVVLVTSGGTSDNDAVRTDSFYFGEERPEKRIHVVWGSLGFYDAVLSATGSAAKSGLAQRRPVKTDLLSTNGRHPSHWCQCEWSCDCRRWYDSYTFPEDVVQSSSPAHVNSSLAQSRPAKSSSFPSTELEWRQVFKYLCKQSFVLEKWKFVMRWLSMSEGTITAIDNDCKGLSEKVFKAFDTWRQENTSDKTIQKLQEALRQESLALVAEGLNQFK